MEELNVLINSISAALNSGLKTLANTAAKDAYDALKVGLARVLSDRDKETHDKVTDALVALENNPASNARQAVLQEEMQQAEVAVEPSIQSLVADLIKALKETDQGKAQLKKFTLQADNLNVGVVGDNATITGGIHIGDVNK